MPGTRRKLFHLAGKRSTFSVPGWRTAWGNVPSPDVFHVPPNLPREKWSIQLPSVPVPLSMGGFCQLFARSAEERIRRDGAHEKNALFPPRRPRCLLSMREREKALISRSVFPSLFFSPTYFPSLVVCCFGGPR